MYRPTEMKEKEEKAPQINSKPKRVLSDLQLEKLKLAREKALAVKQQMKQNSDAQKIQHYEGKIGKIKARQKEEELPLEEVTADLSNCELIEQPVEEEEPQEPKVVVRKSKPKKKPVVIVEESDSDSDEEENVVYIKRRSKKKDKALPPPTPPEPQPQPQPQPQQQMHYPPPIVRMQPNPFYRQSLLQQPPFM